MRVLRSRLRRRMNAETLDTLLRGIAIGGFLATALVLVINGKTNRVVWLGLVFYVCAIAHVLNNAVGLRDAGFSGLSIVLHVQNSTTALLWAFMLSVFDDAKGRFWPRLIPVAIITVLNFLAVMWRGPIMSHYWFFYHLASIIMMGHLLFVMVRGLRNDLVEARRQLRAPLLFMVAGYISFNAWADLTLINDNSWMFFQAGYLAIMAIGSTLGFLNAGPIFWGSLIGPVKLATVDVPEATDGVERVLLTRLKNAMETEEVWKKEGLSIGTLANDLSVPEYRLRRLINESLGYKNFADYINSHRIVAAKAILSDPAQATVSISQIAYDLGFASLGPFNRAFKQDTQLSPSEWRAQNLANS
jgi:AraC-like DNA-binding protein